MQDADGEKVAEGCVFEALRLPVCRCRLAHRPLGRGPASVPQCNYATCFTAGVKQRKSLDSAYKTDRTRDSLGLPASRYEDKGLPERVSRPGRDEGEEAIHQGTMEASGLPNVSECKVCMCILTTVCHAAGAYRSWELEEPIPRSQGTPAGLGGDERCAISMKSGG